MKKIVITPYKDTRSGRTRYFDQYMKEYSYNPAMDGLGSIFSNLNPFKKKEGGTTVGNFLRKIKDTAVRVFKPDASGNPGQEIQKTPANPAIPSHWAVNTPALKEDDNILGIPKKTAIILGVVAIAGIYLVKRNSK